MVDLGGETILDAQTRRTSSDEQKFELVAAGRGIALVPRSVTQSYSRAELVSRPVTDSEPAETCIVVAKGRRERRVRDFVTLAMDLLARGPVPLAVVQC